MANEPLPEPVDWGAFRDADSAVKGASKMVLDDDKASLAIDPFACSSTSFVLRGLSSKGKVDGETLPRRSGFHRGNMAR